MDSKLDVTMTEPLIRLLESVHIDEDRQYVEFRFTDGGDERQVIQIDFEYVESLAACFSRPSYPRSWRHDKAPTGPTDANICDQVGQGQQMPAAGRRAN
jgi:hypothetical protein